MGSTPGRLGTSWTGLVLTLGTTSPLSSGSCDAQVRRWLDRADGLVDVHAVTSLWEQCLEGTDDTVEPTVVHEISSRATYWWPTPG